MHMYMYIITIMYINKLVMCSLDTLMYKKFHKQHTYVYIMQIVLKLHPPLLHTIYTYVVLCT